MALRRAGRSPARREPGREEEEQQERPMSIFVPARVRETAAGFGAEGERWLEELPARVGELEREWSVTAGHPFDSDGHVSWVAPVQCADGGEAVLKISIPHPEAR